VSIDHKPIHDSDDMKVSLDGSRLQAIGKLQPASEADAESIGFLHLMGQEPEIFRAKLEQMMRTQDGLSAWLLKAIDAIADTTEQVETLLINGRCWTEVDTVEDFNSIDKCFRQG
jgi:choline kinase